MKHTLPRRYIRTISDEAAADQGYYIDEAQGRFVCDWIQKYCRQSKGEFAGKPVELMQWQIEDFLMPLFSWMRPDGTRRFTQALLFIPKKNGKSTLVSALGCYFLVADGENGAEVYSAAGDIKQARIIFNESANMVDQSPKLADICKVLRSHKEIQFRTKVKGTLWTGSFSALSADVETKHGFNVSALLFDELHTQPNRRLWDTLQYGVASRRQPMTIALTTAGEDIISLCYDVYDYGKKLLDSKSRIVDLSFFPLIYEAEKEAKWDDETTWAATNPSYGVTLNPKYFHDAITRIREIPSELNSFLRLHLNIWTQDQDSWLDLDAWDRCAMPIDWDEFNSKPCYMGLDLSSTLDLTAFVLVFADDNENYYLKPYFWIPRDNMIKRQRRDRVPYDVWVREGYVTATPGA